MTEVRDKAEESVYRTVERIGRVNSAMLRVSPQSSDALDRLIQRGELREDGYTVTIVPEVVRLTYKPESRPQAETINPKPSKPRRLTYSPLVGPLPARIRQLAGRITHWINIQGDQDAEGRPTCTRRALERALHAYRLPEYKPAIDSLVASKAIAIEGHQVSILGHCNGLPDPFDPDGRKEAKELKQAKRRSRRKRPLSPWVLRKIAERETRYQSEE